MFKMNKKGFALVETLIVSVFVATIFTIMYTNFFPMFGEYERRETYDDVDSIYRTYLIKRMFENPSFSEKNQNYKSTLESTSFVKLFSVNYTIKSDTNNDESSDDVNNDQFSDMHSEINTICTQLTSTNSTYCTNLLSQVKAANIYLTKYNIKDLKANIKNGTISEIDMDAQVQDYIDSLPYYKNNTSDCNYRIIVQYAKEINKESQNYKKIIYSFSTIGVKL